METGDQSPMHSPASSPPVEMPTNAKKEAAQLSRKRSHEDMSASNDAIRDSKTDRPNEPDHNKLANSPLGKLATEPPKIPMPTTMPPPAGKPASTMAPPSSRPPQSGQGCQTAQVTPIGPTQQQTVPKPIAPSPQRADEGSEATIPDDASSDGGFPTPSEPHDRIADFDWTDLERRYHHRMDELGATEHQIYDEFNQLCDVNFPYEAHDMDADDAQFFGVWAATSQVHEVDRSYKRLKTQMTLVQQHEDELERKRDIKVVEAFKSALQLLGN
ncbi:hypothetical protein LTR02_015307 [Friedmanniomyces endolithicus]|nr:hypothetical protein LTR94_019360 [Friedmanniomyces endolithicus]KAK0775087.1 hypothetical protein LTR38_015979 [Friedmanniomyces endolithicus]KAK0777851.1 hypothetical protein LTR75_015825 [Friedmanniomyces endolithicus]KAK0794884.1 hypothetical protein LTR59_007589 [Friedmanniomyces endolithicus]KAK0889631.1 hypothetical protein LTR02_015307 [Friedmanniomyces endolithicus]